MVYNRMMRGTTMTKLAGQLSHGWRLLVWALCPFMLAGCGGVPVDPTEPIKRDALYPKIVLQTLPANGIELAAWTPNDKFIVTAVGQTRSVAIWEVSSGHIIDRLTLPADESETAVVRRLRTMEVASDGRTVTIDAETSFFTDNEFSPSRVRRYQLDLKTKEMNIVAVPEGIEAQWDGAQIEQATEALEMLYEDSEGENPIEWTDQVLLPLPASHDGKWQLRRFAKSKMDLPDGSPAEGGLEIVSADASAEPRLLVHPPMVKFSGASLSPNGRWFATTDAKMIFEDGDDQGKTIFEIFDIEAAEFQPQILLPGDYGEVKWLDDTQILVAAQSMSWDRYNLPAGTTLPDALVIDAELGEIARRMPGRCFILSAPDSNFFGAGTGNCIPSDSNGYGDTAIERFDSETAQWQPFGELSLGEDRVIEVLAISPDGSRLAAATADLNAKVVLHLIDASTGEVLQSKQLEDSEYSGYIQKIEFNAAGNQLLISASRKIHSWNFADDTLTALPLASLDTTLMASDGSLVAVGGSSDDALALFDLASGEQVGALDYGNVVAGGFVPGKPLFWAFSDEGGIRLWDTRDWSELLTAYFFYNQGFMAVTPDGRYDSNIHPYKAQFRWLVPDAPHQSLNSDTFSRDYYTPGVGYRWLACSIEKDCEEAFTPVQSITELNRTLPTVSIRSVEPAAEDPAKAVVTVEITEGVNPDASNGKTHSGIYDPRLFRDHKLTFDYGLDSSAQRFEISQWRETQRLESDEGKVVLRSTVVLPTGGANEDGILISAYAFNEDRLKGETSEFRYIPPPAEPRPRRAFVVSIGIDHYRETRLNLSYAGADALLMGQRLGDIPGYDTRHIAVVTAGPAAASGDTGQPRYVSKDTVLALLGILAGRDRDPLLRKLRQQGIDASALERATPDDLVILSYSGHGWADKRGEFFIVPSEASWADGAVTPQTGSLLSSLELAAALQGIDAGEMALIIDACHSAASVEDGSFKPGPMGDPGLGQLAFDKGVRILSATQADDVALEDSRLRQGLLTFALAAEGLEPGSSEADLDEDGRIDLTEWLDYAVWRLPLLSEDVRVGNFGAAQGPAARALVFFDPAASQAKPKVQKPSLFDFNIEPSQTVLRGDPW